MEIPTFTRKKQAKVPIANQSQTESNEKEEHKGKARKQRRKH